VGAMVLVVAAWGYPPQWGLTEYAVSAEHPSFRDMQQLRCSSCSSTLALAEFFRRGGHDVEVLVLGVDTAETPREGESGRDFRRRVEERYRAWADELLKRTGCASAELKVDVVALPGIGTYGGWRFRGTPMAVFNSALSAIVRRKGQRPSFIALDLSHGVNYQAVSALYAATAAAAIWGKTRLLVFNSDPYPPGVRSPRCLEAAAGGQAASQSVPELNLNDVSGLHEVVSSVMQVAQLRRLQVRADTVKMLGNALGPELERLVRHVCALMNGAAALAWEGAVIEGMGQPFALPERIDVREPESTPVIGRGEVSYPEADPAYAVRAAAHAVLDDLRRLQSRDLAGFMQNVAEHYERLGMVSTAAILEEAAQDLTLVPKYAGLLLKKLGRTGEELAPEELMLLAEPFKALEMAGEEVRERDRKDALERLLSSEELLRKALQGLREWLERERDRARRCARSPDSGCVRRALRNLLAHGGLSYPFVKSTAVSGSGISRVVFDAELLKAPLRPSRVTRR